MEQRIRYYVERTKAICDPECPDVAIDQSTTYEDYKDTKKAESEARKTSLTNKLDYPIRVIKRHEVREEPEIGYSWKKGKGWNIDFEVEEEIISEWWKGKKC
uniref:Uncharacterized protein n=1 Tax=viral metagenome TaxID=1070528 RepID=A0A6M3LQQ7_9ZZZZ